ncbi:MAG: GNAT family N-acetyltransferase [Coriobacteriales bacterium]
MHIREVTDNKKRYLPLLLLADEQESMIDRYLGRGTMYVLEDNGVVKAECIVTDEGDGVLEIKSIAVDPAFQCRGYGRALVEFIAVEYRGKFDTLQVGTGESPLTLSFYEACGFERSHVVEDFFTDNYDHPIIEGGIRLKDMIYLQRRL